MLLFLSFLLWMSPCVLAKETGRCPGEDILLKTWHNVSCTTDDDCNQQHVACYDHRCRCAPGYFYTTYDTCSGTCSTDELHNTFTEYPDSAIRANLLNISNGLCLEDCRDWCLADKRCLTFDFKAHRGLCLLHNVTAHDSPSDWSPKTSKGWTHYQRSCKSTFASHDNWYNLLCNSKMDCADTNSDCLSGRCLCNLGFNFNESEKECVVTKLSKWHNTSCTTDDDCDEPHSVCYKHQCRCHPGYFYTTHDTCTSTCSTNELHNTFTEYPDSAIRANNLTSWDGVSLKDCKDWCQDYRRCLTFDFKAHGGLCRLHEVTGRQSPSDWSPKTSKGWTHYQRSCKSTFASHHNWYNLLCHSKMDCADPNSDCLLGRCLCHSGFNFNENEKRCTAPGSCEDWQGKGGISGVYTIQLAYNNGPVAVWCDMDTAGGGWLVIQRRRDFTVDFHRNWTEYVNGFGNLSGDFWLRMSAISILTSNGGYRLRVDLIAESGKQYWAEYWFRLFGPESDYLIELFSYSGDAGDGMRTNSRHLFQTYDRNPDGCVTSSKGAWWYYQWRGCKGNANLNSPDKRHMTWGTSAA
ncbi:tenascin-like [Pomacea canaliculata]|uniref:tenascin-like n=1 Tax=Pomacea canaliculata TaxID=400727 RepID=UPI000D731697|nr:tenascin-like [Pomacea canaliculata]